MNLAISEGKNPAEMKLSKIDRYVMTTGKFSTLIDTISSRITKNKQK
jgi:hypothetical protein